MAFLMADKSVQQYSDPEIIRQILAGNTALFEIIIRRYNPYLYKVGRSYGFNHQDTEDLMQETFINSYVNLKQFAERSSFKTWLITIMLHDSAIEKHINSITSKSKQPIFYPTIHRLCFYQRTTATPTMQS